MLAAAAASTEMEPDAVPQLVNPNFSSDSSTNGNNSVALYTPLTSVSEESSQQISTRFAESLSQQSEKMSFGQSRLWFPSIYLEDKTAYNCTTSYRLNGPLDIYRLERSLELVIQRHQSFRTSFYTESSTGQATQAISPSSLFTLEKIPSANTSDDVDCVGIHPWTY